MAGVCAHLPITSSGKGVDNKELVVEMYPQALWRDLIAPWSELNIGSKKSKSWGTAMGKTSAVESYCEGLWKTHISSLCVRLNTLKLGGEDPSRKLVSQKVKLRWELQELFYLSLTINCYQSWLCPASGKPHIKPPNLWDLYYVQSCLSQTSGKAECQMPLSWISGWGGYTSEVLWGILRLAEEQMFFDTLLHFLFGMLTCLWVTETVSGKSLGHLIVLLLMFWNRAPAAVRCKVCCSPRADTVRGVLRACWILGITAESSAPRATDHAACPLQEWDSIAL